MGIIKNLVTGGAGFLGINLTEKLISNGEFVYCFDNFCTGNKLNFANFSGHKNFHLINGDIRNPIENIKVDRIWHLACPCEPSYYQENSLLTLETNFLGTKNVLDLAVKLGAKVLFTSSSEVYGNSIIHPQKEDYKGNVNFRGKRSCYDEGKRVAESLCANYAKCFDIDIRTVRIFNTYGPNMRINDSRVISSFIFNAIKKKDLIIFGKGKQTRSFCYVDDLIKGIIKAMDSDIRNPINLGNTEEISILDLAYKIRKKINPSLNINFLSCQEDDPQRRLPDIS